MRRWVLSMLWLMMSGGTAIVAPTLSAKEPVLHVYLVECVRLEDGLMEAIRAEVESLYRTAGFTIVWLDAAPNPAKPSEARAYIMDELPPSLQSLMKSSKGRGPMALTLGSDPKAPGADIYLSRQAVLARAGHRQALALKHVGRALGRALVHELAHRFLRSGHTTEGVLRPAITERDLIDGDSTDLFFTAEQIRVLEAVAGR